MTKDETAIIMDILEAAYPRAFTGQPRRVRNMLSLWHEMFAEDDVRLVAAAVKAIIAADEKGFFPAIGAVKAKMRMLTERPEMTEAEAWDRVYSAICRSGYDSEEEYAALPAELQAVVGSPRQLKAWSDMDIPTLQSVVASNFMRSYRAKVAHAREIAALPADVKAVIASTVSGLAQLQTGRE